MTPNELPQNLNENLIFKIDKLIENHQNDQTN